MPNWVDDELERVAELHAAQRSEEQLPQAVQRWWEQLAAGIQRDIERVRERNIDAEFSQPQAGNYRVRNAEQGITLTVDLDPDACTVHFDYASDHSRTAVPEGGIFSLRMRGARLVPYYADQELTQDRVLNTLLKPVLFPSEPSEQAA